MEAAKGSVKGVAYVEVNKLEESAGAAPVMSRAKRLGLPVSIQALLTHATLELLCRPLQGRTYPYSLHLSVFRNRFRNVPSPRD